MTAEQGETARSVMFGMFCLAIIGVYGWWSWQSQRNLKRTQDRLVDVARARYERDLFMEQESADGEV